MNVTWPSDKISSLLREAFIPKPATKVKQATDQPPTATIDVLITFDAQGVSLHPNHISLYHGARAFVASLTTNKREWSAPVDMYTLTTVNIFRKFTGILDVFSTLGSTALSVWRGGLGSQAASGLEMKKHPTGFIFMHGLGQGGWITAREAMTGAHVSQMVWFRYGWITLSRYMFMNDLRLERP